MIKEYRFFFIIIEDTIALFLIYLFLYQNYFFLIDFHFLILALIILIPSFFLIILLFYPLISVFLNNPHFTFIILNLITIQSISIFQ